MSVVGWRRKGTDLRKIRGCPGKSRSGKGEPRVRAVCGTEAGCTCAGRLLVSGLAGGVGGGVSALGCARGVGAGDPGTRWRRARESRRAPARALPTPGPQLHPLGWGAPPESSGARGLGAGSPGGRRPGAAQRRGRPCGARPAPRRHPRDAGQVSQGPRGLAGSGHVGFVTENAGRPGGGALPGRAGGRSRCPGDPGRDRGGGVGGDGRAGASPSHPRGGLRLSVQGRRRAAQK